ncbi:hypothetical protein ACFSHQ_16830 [Gemmobacter lanyuensis]
MAPYVASVLRAGAIRADRFWWGYRNRPPHGRGRGVPCILVSFGPEGAGIARLAPTAMLDDYADLPGLVERLRG